MKIDSREDNAVLEQVKKGNIDSFEVLVKKYTPHVYKLCKAKLSSKEDAEDLTQNSFISLYKSIERLDSKRPLLPYLYMIARNELKMFYRSHKSSVPLDEETAAIADNSPTTDDSDTSLILKQMSPDQQTALQMVYDGYSYQEIAKRLHKPINTVRTIIRRARLQIKNTHKSL